MSLALVAFICDSCTENSCGLKFSSGQDIRDNVASVMLSATSSSGLVVDVFGTCRFSEDPVDPLFIESLTELGCSDLKFPLQGHVALRHRPAERP